MQTAPDRPRLPNDPSTIVFLSLYLLLLTFFIMLATIAQAEKKRAEQTLVGLERTFGGSAGRASIVSMSGGQQTIDGGRLLQERVSEVFRSHDELDNLQSDEDRGELVLTVPSERFFADGQAALSKQGLALAKALNEIADGPEGARFTTSVLLPTGSVTWALSPLPVDRATTLARALASPSGDGPEIGLIAAKHKNIVWRYRPLPRQVAEAGARQ